MAVVHLSVMVLTALVLVVHVPPSQGQSIFLGQCPTVTVKKPFDPTQYLGKWYEYKKYPVIYEAGGSCITATYTDKGSGVIGVNNRQYYALLRKYTSIEGTATVKTAGEGKLGVRFPSVGNNEANYWVLGTDYTKFSVVWSCTNLLFFNVQSAWVLTRDQVPTAATLALANDVLVANNIDQSRFKLTSQSNCPA